MKIVSWNCNGALRKKLPQLLTLEADIYVVQECECPERVKDARYKAFAQASLWVGDNKNSGMGVFSVSARITELEWASNGLQSFLPFTINESITALAVWTKRANSPNFGYIGQAWKYLQAHKHNIPRERAIVCGDFNSNTCWDEWDRWWNHSDVVRDLSELGLESVYHHATGEQQGRELQPTFFMHRKTEKPYHIDYAFASADILASSTISIGRAEDWLQSSDHMPIVWTFVA